MVNRVKTEYINNLAKRLIEAGFMKHKSMRGCNNRFLEKIEKKYNIKLPRYYRDFLLVMGRPKRLDQCKNFNKMWEYYSHFYSQPPFMSGDVYYDEPLKPTNRARTEQKTDLLKPTDFVFLWRSSIFFFFPTDKGDNPPVHYYREQTEYNKMMNNFDFYESNWKNKEIKRKYLYTPNGGQIFSTFSDFLESELEISKYEKKIKKDRIKEELKLKKEKELQRLKIVKDNEFIEELYDITNKMNNDETKKLFLDSIEEIKNNL